MHAIPSISERHPRMTSSCPRCDRSVAKLSSLALLLTMASALCISSVQMAAAQTEIVLHAFKGGTDGSYPLDNVLVRDPNGNLFGTTVKGGGAGCGSVGCGTVFKVFPRGQETVRYRFA